MRIRKSKSIKRIVHISTDLFDYGPNFVPCYACWVKSKNGIKRIQISFAKYSKIKDFSRISRGVK